MALVVKTNVPSLMSQRNLSSTNRALQGSMAKLSSGYRINTAADDAAGLAVSEEMKADIQSLAMAMRNANDAVSVFQTAEGSLGEVGDLLIRMRELVVQSQNGSLNNEQRSHIQTELQQLKLEVNNISQRTEFNGNYLLDDGTGTGAAPPLTFQVGIEATDTITWSPTQSFTASNIGVSGGTQVASIFIATGAFQIADDGTVGTVGSVTTASDALGALDAALNRINTERASLGALQNRVELKLENLAVYRENLAAANSRIRDVDFASEMAIMTKNQILMQSGTAMLAQANALPQSALALLQGARG